MRTIRTQIACLALLLAGAVATPGGPGTEDRGITLPQPDTTGELSLEAALAARRSVRAFSDDSLTLTSLTQLAWAAQGVSDEQRGLRTAPSAGALYPLELLVAVGNVDELSRGLYRYRPDYHSLARLLELPSGHEPLYIIPVGAPR